MEIYSTEEQQVDAIKQFWKDYGNSILIGAVVGLGGLYAWNYYSDVKVAQAEEASKAFHELTTKSSDEAAMLAGVAEFSKSHDQKGYQALLELIVAKTAVEAKDYPKAIEALNKVIAAKPGSGLDVIATLRVARIQAEQGQIDAALATLDQVTDKAFFAQRDELKGDFLVRQGEVEKAKTAYQAAMDNGGVVTSPALKIKLDSLNQA
ncbi:tetratricopeptide repeat protein [Shewanella baltica]|uniref:tetratricopeptide repeat protein n=1 Tax=Shewanella baltica TaxID=62322 RepID=UPI00217E6B0C|nr:tetratricopeptide repeat protein [Shewanella baltica]MCS6204570.1 tetratricopeptide repeat protein [Shewanella baltica]MCS6233640.1 tetratricopeptide repeat protein [Shewanella baltica]MCS6268224.1 tetratricopeptide repeat protein [Shewanella baltica]